MKSELAATFDDAALASRAPDPAELARLAGPFLPAIGAPASPGRRQPPASAAVAAAAAATSLPSARGGRESIVRRPEPPPAPRGAAPSPRARAEKERSFRKLVATWD